MTSLSLLAGRTEVKSGWYNFLILIWTHRVQEKVWILLSKNFEKGVQELHLICMIYGIILFGL